MRTVQVIPEPAATKVPAGEDVQVTFKAQFAPNLPRPGLVGVAVNGVYHTCTPGAPKPTATTKVWSLTFVYCSLTEQRIQMSYLLIIFTHLQHDIMPKKHFSFTVLDKERNDGRNYFFKDVSSS